MICLVGQCQSSNDDNKSKQLRSSFTADIPSFLISKLKSLTIPMPIPPKAGGEKNTQDLAVKTKFLTINKEKEEKNTTKELCTVNRVGIRLLTEEIMRTDLHYKNSFKRIYMPYINKSLLPCPLTPTLSTFFPT